MLRRLLLGPPFLDKFSPTRGGGRAGRTVGNGWIVGMGTAAACSSACSEAPRVERPLSSWETLAAVEADRDPYSSHRPDSVDCNPLTGWFVEGDGRDAELEIDTAHCNYAGLTQVTTNEVKAGEHITATLSFFELTSPVPARAHFAIHAAGMELFSREFELPGPADVIDLDIVAREAISEGTPLTIHLHNHGQNTWNLTSLWVGSGDR